MRRLMMAVWAGALALSACKSDNSTGPALAHCVTPHGAPVALAVAAYTAIDPAADSGCIGFPANASSIDTAEYLVLAQSASGTPGASSAFALAGDNIIPIAPPTMAASTFSLPDLGQTARTFDHYLRQIGLLRMSPLTPSAAAESPTAPPPAAGPPAVGSQRTFKVCGNLTCSSLKSVTATAKAVGSHIAVYLDNAAPGNGLDSAQIDTLRAVFDTRLYAIDTTAFGRESDADSNGVVVVLMSNAVNALVTKTQCTSSGFIAGYFLPADLDPSTAAQFNHGEVFYSIVADPTGTLSCAHSAAAVMTNLPPVFLHEFQHMINFVQHVLVHGGFPEDDWVDEGLSKLAEELGGRSFLPADSVSFSNYAIGDVVDAYRYLDSTGTHPMVTNTDQDLADVGAGWLFMRYLVDQYGAGISRTLVQTSLTGASNVTSATGQPLAMLVERWGLANWVSDLPGFTPPAELQYTAWHFRRTYQSIHTQDPIDFPAPYPLVPLVAAAGMIDLSGTLHAGSATYVRILQAPSGPAFTVTFAGPGGGALSGGIAAQLTVIRIR